MTKRIVLIPIQKIVVLSLGVLFLLNQLLLTQVSASMGMQMKSNHMIVGPKINIDGKTTSLAEWPTMSEVMANPRSGNVLADAKAVMTAKGQPFYAPGDISFDDPINAQKKWGEFETSIKLTPDEEARYQNMISSIMTCSYCCGSPNSVTMIKNCGCAHAKAVRGMYRFMIQNFGDTYSDEEMVGESHRWYALWYPKGMLEDYLLFTGDENALPHETHGGAGQDGRHGITK
ncbi:MAG: hypothetical protein COY80_02735 [Candidatus Pacebacteria bacterium CG_4_10_14_0_8_um_filter_42_14]|nr:MAG: hypothetical protein COY80_02735 [Candidatus Pacebacteria bacterium CG_4_10_14_0_8_um_filter_42_14]